MIEYIILLFSDGILRYNLYRLAKPIDMDAKWDANYYPILISKYILIYCIIMSINPRATPLADTELGSKIMDLVQQAASLK